MSQEITLSATIAATKSGNKIVSDSVSATFDMSGNDGGTLTQSIGTTDESIGFPADVATGQAILIQNLDTTNYVEISYGTGGSFSGARIAKLDASKGFALFKPISLPIYAQANTAACRIKASIVST